MFELAKDLLPLVRSGTPVAVVTVTQVARSAPRGVGSSMAVTLDGTVIGSISGGCIESDAGMLAQVALATGRGQTARFGFTDDAAHAAGLACGGSIEVIAYPIRADDSTALAALEAAAADRPAAIAVAVDGPHAGTLLDPATWSSPDEKATIEDAIRRREPLILRSTYTHGDVLLMTHTARPRLIILGGGEHAAALCRVGSAAGYAVTVCDVWDSLVTPERFPTADRLVAAWPHEFLAELSHAEIDERTAICVLTHDTRQDIPALRVALSLPVGFVGAMGARNTVHARADALREQGVAEVDLARLHSPLGLDLGGASPEDTALSVLAEIVASRHGGSGTPLRERTGPLHRDGRTRRLGDDESAASGSCSIAGTGSTATSQTSQIHPAGAPT